MRCDAFAVNLVVFKSLRQKCLQHHLLPVSSNEPYTQTIELVINVGDCFLPVEYRGGGVGITEQLYAVLFVGALAGTPRNPLYARE